MISGMPIITMQTGTTSVHHDVAGSKKSTECAPQALGVIENPLFERSSERNVSSASGPSRVLREMSENQRDRRRSFVQRGLQRSKTVKEYVHYISLIKIMNFDELEQLCIFHH